MSHFIHISFIFHSHLGPGRGSFAIFLLSYFLTIIESNIVVVAQTYKQMLICLYDNMFSWYPTIA